MSDQYINDLVRKRNDASDEMHRIVTNAERAARNLSKDEVRRLEDLETDFGTYTAEVARLTALRAKIGPAAQRLAASSGFDRSFDPGLRDAFARAKEGAHVAFDAYLSTEFETRGFETRALQSAGGSAVPTSFADFVTVYERTHTPMLDPNVVTVLGTRDGAPIVLPRITADAAPNGTVTAEAAGITELDPTLSSVTLTTYKYPLTTLWSAELDQDNVVGIEELIARTNGRALGLAIGSALTTGDGSAKPTGFIQNAPVAGTAAGTASWGASATFFGWGDIVTLYGSVASAYRQNGVWMLSTDAYVKALQFRDSNNAPILIPGLGGDPATMLGRPVYENPAMAAVASASKSIAFGDFSRYVVHKVNPTRVEVSREYKFNTDQVALKTVERVDGNLIDTAAVKVLLSANT